MMNKFSNLMLFMLFIVGLVYVYVPSESIQLYADEKSNLTDVEYFIVPDRLLGLTKETTDVDVKSIVDSKLPYLASNFNQMAEISDLARINMLIPLSIIYTVNSNNNEHNILNLRPDQLFPDKQRYKCSDRDTVNEHEFEQFMNVCNSVVNASSSNIAQYQALVIALAETRTRLGSNLEVSQDLQNRSAYTNMATIVIQDVYSELNPQLLKLNSLDTKIVSNNLKNAFIELFGKPLVTRNMQEIRQKRLTSTQVTNLLNSRQIGWPWKSETSKCFNASHGAYAAGTHYSAMDIGVCGKWGTGPNEEIFDVYAVDDGVSIGFNKDSAFISQCRSYKYIETTVGSNKIQYFYYHLNLTESEAQIGKQYRYQEIIGKVSNESGANCGSGTGGNNGFTHLHFGIYVNNQEISLENVLIGGWKYVIVDRNATAYAGVDGVKHYRYCAVEMQRGNSVRVAKDWTSNGCKGTKDTSVTNDFYRNTPNLTAPTEGFTTSDGLWPTLSWDSTSNGPFEINVSRNESFSDCIVCQEVTEKSYRPTGRGADAWMRARTGKLYWRVRVKGGDWSATGWFNNSFASVQLTSPAMGFTTSDGLWPTLSWNSTSNGPFEVRVSRNENFSDCIVCQEVTEKSYRPTGSGADAWMRARTGILHWRVRVKGGDWSARGTFRNTFVAPQLVSPAMGFTTSDGLWPTLSWSSSFNGPFEVRVSRNENFSDCIVCQEVTEKSYRPTGRGADAWMRARTGPLHWRVRVVGGDWSTRGTFNNTFVRTSTPTRTPTPVSVVPVLQSPADGFATSDGLWPTLSWNSLSNGPFEIRVSRNPNFSDCVVCQNVTEKSYRPTGSGADSWMRDRTGKFYWRVRVVGGEWSSKRFFNNTAVKTITPTRTPTPVSVVPVLQSPAEGFTTSDGLWPTLSWNSTSNGPFEIRVSRNSNFSDCVVCQNVTEKFYRPTGSGADAWMRDHIGPLHWRVRVVGGEWSPKRSFTNRLVVTRTWTPTRVPPTSTHTPTASPRPTDAELTMPILQSPSDGATDVSTKVELDWADVTKGNVNRYEVEICIETSRNSNNWSCDKYDTNGAESRWKVWDRTNKIFPQRKIRWRVNANDGTKDGPVSGWRYFQPRYTYPVAYSVSGDTFKLSVSRESNDITYQCKYNFSGFGSGGSWSSVDKSSFSGSSCSFSLSSMRSKGAYSGRVVYWIITSDSNKTLGDFSGRENTDSRSWYFNMP